ncbi:hypothetical protein GBF38_014664 [Nibea albiflora]|uniref:Uncharacterized protein n=1 Tax=Nibea albiflora TaxID=240163 RepID=A0ACB7F5B8_NIBAL|nr:hypothetical protein GBF38_014664 [Nibea albiflora]
MQDVGPSGLVCVIKGLVPTLGLSQESRGGERQTRKEAVINNLQRDGASTRHVPTKTLNFHTFSPLKIESVILQEDDRLLSLIPTCCSRQRIKLHPASLNRLVPPDEEVGALCVALHPGSGIHHEDC